METKLGVSILGMRPELLYALIIAEQVYKDRFSTLVITSCKDGKHGKNSYHYRGLAADLRTRGTGLARQIRDDLVKALAPLGFDVLLEDEGGVNEHIHMEADLKKMQKVYKDNTPADRQVVHTYGD